MPKKKKNEIKVHDCVTIYGVAINVYGRLQKLFAN